MEFPEDSPLLRSDELSRRLAVSDHMLRAWENRHGPPGPPGRGGRPPLARSAGNGPRAASRQAGWSR